MAAGSAELHEAAEVLHPATIDRHRAIASLMEEMEAVDWYDQRVDAVEDAELRAILEHNRDEEKEHAAMVLEWLRRRDPVLDGYLRQYLFSDRPIIQIEEEEEEKDAAGSSPPRERDSLGIGSLRERRAG